jgi:hypothetical protein
MSMRSAAALTVVVVTTALAGCAAPGAAKSPEGKATAVMSVTHQPGEPRGRDAYLQELKAAHVPVSVRGDSEVRIGEGVCEQLKAGASEGSLADDLARGIPVWTRAQALTVVRTARDTLC